LVLSDLQAIASSEPALALGLTADRSALRDGQLIPARLTGTLQGAAERSPETTFQQLTLLLERQLLLLVGEVDRPVALVDSFESVNVFLSELHQRLAALE
jgi:hypothetical protein